MTQLTTRSRKLQGALALLGGVAVALSLTACGGQQSPQQAPQDPQETSQTSQETPETYSQTDPEDENKPIPGLVDGVYFSEPNEKDRVWRLAVSDGGTEFVYSQAGCEKGPDLEYDEFVNIDLSYGKLNMSYGNGNSTLVTVTVDGDKVNFDNDKLEYFNADLEKKDPAEVTQLEEKFCFPQKQG